jgi:hypothetical protein
MVESLRVLIAQTCHPLKMSKVGEQNRIPVPCAEAAEALDANQVSRRRFQKDSVSGLMTTANAAVIIPLSVGNFATTVATKVGINDPVTASTRRASELDQPRRCHR